MMHITAYRAYQERFKQLSFLLYHAESPLMRANCLIKLDELLDEYNEFNLGASMWDMDQWKLDPDNWMIKERRELRHRGGSDFPHEPCYRVPPKMASYSD